MRDTLHVNLAKCYKINTIISVFGDLWKGALWKENASEEDWKILRKLNLLSSTNC